MVNIRDLSKYANVSVTTVSRVLNNHPYVASEKREKVLEAIKALNYTPNHLAINLSKGKTNTIAIVIPYINNPYYNKILEGSIQSASKYGYNIITMESKYNEEEEVKALEMLRNRLIDGIIFTTRHISLSKIKNFSTYGPIILMEKQKDFKYVYIDQSVALNDATNYLLAKGYKKIGYTIHRSTGFSAYERKKAYGLLDEKFTSADFIFTGHLSILDGKNLAYEWLERSNKPDALIVTNDAVSIGLYLTLKEEGIKIPQELAIISYENSELSFINHITSVDLPLIEMGKKSVELAIDENKDSMKVKHKLIERLST